MQYNGFQRLQLHDQMQLLKEDQQQQQQQQDQKDVEFMNAMLPVDFARCTSNSNGYDLNTDFQWQNAIFQTTADAPGWHVNNSGSGNNSTMPTSPILPDNAQDILALNESFFRSFGSKCMSSVNIDIPPFSALTLLTNEPGLKLDTQTAVDCNDDDVMTLQPDTATPTDADAVNTRTSRKVLPHKKRIARKLKATQAAADAACFGQTVPNLLQYRCELCSYSTDAQLDFFNHLKQHYEPSQNVAFEPMAFDIETAENANNAPTVEGSQTTHTHNALNMNLYVPEMPIELQPEDTAAVVPIAIHCNKTVAQAAAAAVAGSCLEATESTQNLLNNCLELQPTTTTTTINPLETVITDINGDDVEVEFSDTEDMLDMHIRNVVDKVSIEDTCDEIDAMMLAGNFSDLHFKNSKTFSDLSFSEPLSQILSMEEVADADADDTTTSIGNEMIKKETTLHINDAVLAPKPNDAEKETDLMPLLDLKMSKKQHVCDKCQRCFNSLNALKYHDLSHSGIRAYSCEICSKAFYALGALKNHLHLHSGVKPNKCEHCEQTFRQSSDLRYHIESKHSMEKLHICEFCGKSFARKYSLVLHTRIHTQENNYKCEFCDKSFRASAYLQMHRKLHTGEKPYSCEHCGKKFRISSGLRRHLSTHLGQKRKKGKTKN